MPGLILKLRPHEELMVNGVVLENGARKTRLRVKTEGARILRLRDALKPEEATTPLERAYYIAQLAVGGGMAPGEAAQSLTEALAALDEALPDEARGEIAALVANGDFYRTMRALGEAMAPRRNTSAQAEATDAPPAQA